MAENTPPYVLQAGSHSAQLFRQAISTLIGPISAGGVITPGDYAVTAQSVPNMTVNVAGGVPGGQAWVAGSTSVGVQGLYYCFNDGIVILSHSASNPTNPRIDIDIIQVQDSNYFGSVNTATLGVVTGTPASSPAQPATPASSLLLSAVAIAANATTITNGNITQKQVQLGANNYFAGHLGSNVTLGVNTNTEVLVTPSLAVGLWDLSMVGTMLSTGAGDEGACDIVVKTGTAGLEGNLSASLGFSTTTFQATGHMRCVVTVSAAATIALHMIYAGAGGGTAVAASTYSNLGLTQQTAYVARRILAH